MLLIRHAQSFSNLLGRHIPDAPLTERGEYQADVLGRYLNLLEKNNFDLIVLSPLERAQRTAHLARLQGQEVITSDLCVEWGDVEGETFEQFLERMEKLREFLSTCPYNTAVVCHAVVICTLTGARMANAEYTEVDPKELLKLHKWNQ